MPAYAYPIKINYGYEKILEHHERIVQEPLTLDSLSFVKDSRFTIIPKDDYFSDEYIIAWTTHRLETDEERRERIEKQERYNKNRKIFKQTGKIPNSAKNTGRDTTMNEIDNTQDIIDSRDVESRIDELESEQEDMVSELNNGEISEQDMREWDINKGRELDALRALRDQASPYSEDWKYGESLIRDSYFEEYARELAEDTGMVDECAAWPVRHIDWTAAADELKGDYTEVDFNGVTYWIC